MKKSAFLICISLVTLSAMAFSLLKKSDSLSNLDIVHKIDSRYMTTITKSDLDDATSVLDIVPSIANDWWVVSFSTVTIAVLTEDGEILSVGNTKELNEGQKELLQSTDYSTDFYIKARRTDIHPETGKIEDYTYHFTIVPEKEARYTKGTDALIRYLEAGTKEVTLETSLDQLKPGQVSFTVTKDGSVEDVKLLSSSGYFYIDETLVQLIRDMPHNWKAATDDQGDAVEQQLVFYFGLPGC